MGTATSWAGSPALQASFRSSIPLKAVHPCMPLPVPTIAAWWGPASRVNGKQASECSKGHRSTCSQPRTLIMACPEGWVAAACWTTGLMMLPHHSWALACSLGWEETPRDLAQTIDLLLSSRRASCMNKTLLIEISRGLLTITARFCWTPVLPGITQLYRLGFYLLLDPETGSMQNWCQTIHYWKKTSISISHAAFIIVSKISINDQSRLCITSNSDTWIMKHVEIIELTSKNSFPLGENIRLTAIIYYLLCLNTDLNFAPK